MDMMNGAFGGMQNMQQSDSFMKNFQKMSKGKGGIPMQNMTEFTQLCGYNPTRKQMNEAIDANDMSGSQMFSFDDCQKLLSNGGFSSNVEKELREAFKNFDKDGTNTLDAEEFRQIMLSYGEEFTEEEFEQMMEQFDKNKNGKIDIDEFVAMMNPSNQMQSMQGGFGGGMMGGDMMNGMMGGDMMGNMMTGGGMMNMGNSHKQKSHGQSKDGYEDHEVQEENFEELQNDYRQKLNSRRNGYDDDLEDAERNFEMEQQKRKQKQNYEEEENY